jgi:hypothetical protein
VHKVLLGVLAAGLVLTGCGAERTASAPAAPTMVPDVALNDLLLSVEDVNAATGATALKPQPLETEMGDNRNLLPNKNCLGVWQPDEASIYGERGGPTGWSAMRRQVLRQPDSEQWDFLAVQSVISYPSPGAAKAFFSESADRWSKCTNHKVNITLNNQPLPKWLSGVLDRTPTRLSMPISRGVGDHGRSCQHVLAVAANIIIDVETCTPQSFSVTQAGVITDRIEAAITAA